MSECHLRKASPLSILTASGPLAGGTASPTRKPGLRAQYLPRPIHGGRAGVRVSCAVSIGRPSVASRSQGEQEQWC